MNFLKRVNEQLGNIKSNVENGVRYDQAKIIGLISFLVETKAFLTVWAHPESKTFVLSPELVTAFQNTDIPKLETPANFHYPFRSFTIESSVPLFYTKISDGTLIPVHTIGYTTKHFMEETGIGRFDHSDPEYGKWDSMLHGFYLIEGQVNRIRMNYNSLNSIGKEIDFLNSIPPLDGDHRLDNDDEKNMINIFFNTVMYVTDPNRVAAETERRDTKIQGTGEGRGTRTQDYIYLKPPPSYTSLPKDKKSGRVIDSRFIVRGHWRNQAHGEERKLRKLVWIQPFYKGPEFSEAVNKSYKVA